MRTQAKIRNLRKKQEEFKAQGDFSRATQAKIIAVLLEDIIE